MLTLLMMNLSVAPFQASQRCALGNDILEQVEELEEDLGFLFAEVYFLALLQDLFEEQVPLDQPFSLFLQPEIEPEVGNSDGYLFDQLVHAPRIFSGLRNPGT